jgi:hypothetical protein
LDVTGSVTVGSNISVSGIVTAGTFSGNLTGNVTSSGVTTIATLNATSIVGVSTAGITTAYVGSINDGPISGTRNRIINGNFDVWQRGTATGSWVAPVTNFYWPDRWVFTSNGTGGNGSASQQAFSAGQTDVPGEPTYFLRWQITSAASGQTTGGSYVEQRIEDVRTFAGQTATLSFYAKGTGTLPNIYATQTFGSGGSSQVVYTLASSVTLNANWTKYTYTFTFGSLSGKTIGTNHYVGVTFMVPINSTYTFDLAQVQFEPGPVATPFERRIFGQELALCQRYYEQSDFSEYYQLPSSSATQVQRQNKWWRTTKRASPTVTVTKTGGSSGSTVGTDGTSQNSVYFSFGGGQFEIITWSWTASAEL